MLRLFPFALAAVIAVVANASVFAEATAINRGKIKNVFADKKQFVLTDRTDNKDYTYTLGNNVNIDRGDKTSGIADLKVGEDVSVLFDRGLTTWTAEYVMVHADTNANRELHHVAVKSFNEEKKELTVTENGKDLTLPYGSDSKTLLNGESVKMSALKLGDRALLVTQRDGDRVSVHRLIVQRSK